MIRIGLWAVHVKTARRDKRAQNGARASWGLGTARELGLAKPMFSRAIVLAFCGLFSAGAVACSSSETPPGDAPPTPEVDPAASAPSRVESTCQILSKWASNCASKNTGCDEEFVSACSGIRHVVSGSVADAARSCVTSRGCSSTPSVCFTDALTRAMPSDALIALADNYCTSCQGSDAANACRDAFLSLEKNPDIKLLLPLSDALLSEIGASCTARGDCRTGFSKCAESVVTRAITEQLSESASTCALKLIFEERTSGGTCRKKTCAELGLTCGEGRDGCGGTLDCGTCNPNCKAKTCAALGKTCGKHDDGCGKLVDCGPCSPVCQPATCADLEQPCGSRDDGCGGVLSCGTCPNQCRTDAREPNDTVSTSTMLADMKDAPSSSQYVRDLSLPDGDEDWFTFRVTDAGYQGNPRVYVSATKDNPTESSLDVAVWFVCDSGGDASRCTFGSDFPDNTHGRGCRAIGSAGVNTECNGVTESGTAIVRVRKIASDAKCGGYSLFVSVNEY